MTPTLKTIFMDPKDANVARQPFDVIVVIVVPLLFVDRDTTGCLIVTWPYPWAKLVFEQNGNGVRLTISHINLYKYI